MNNKDKLIVVCGLTIVIGFFIFLGHQTIYDKEDIKSEMMTPILPPQSVVALNATHVICLSSNLECYMTENILIDGGYELYSKSLDLRLFVKYYQKIDDAFIPSVSGFCNSDICFENPDDILFVSISTQEPDFDILNYKKIEREDSDLFDYEPAVNSTMLDFVLTKNYNDRFHHPAFININNNTKGSFVFPVDISGYSEPEWLEKEPFDFRIFLFSNSTQQSNSSVKENEK